MSVIFKLEEQYLPEWSTYPDQLMIETRHDASGLNISVINDGESKSSIALTRAQVQQLIYALAWWHGYYGGLYFPE